MYHCLAHSKSFLVLAIVDVIFTVTMAGAEWPCSISTATDVDWSKIL